MIPALEMVSTVNIVPAFTHCSLVRVAVLAKFVLSFMASALQNHSVLLLTQKEVDYITSQLSEAVVDGSSSHWYTDLELLKVLINLTQHPHFSKNIQIMRGKDSVLSIAMQFLQSSNLDVIKASLRLLLNFYSLIDHPSIEKVHGENASTIKMTLTKLASAKEVNIQQLAKCAQLLLDPILEESKFHKHE